MPTVNGLPSTNIDTNQCPARRIQASQQKDPRRAQHSLFGLQRVNEQRREEGAHALGQLVLGLGRQLHEQACENTANTSKSEPPLRDRDKQARRWQSWIQQRTQSKLTEHEHRWTHGKRGVKARNRPDDHRQQRQCKGDVELVMSNVEGIH